MEFKVRVGCMTYNQAPYIKDALDGFCKQETDFPFLCTIFDDASTDGEQDIIKQYLQDHFELENRLIAKEVDTDDYSLVFAQHKDNRNCFFAVLFLKYNHYSINKSKLQYISDWRYSIKYTALCEGDDYWDAPSKLQKQYDYMEMHPDISLCFHANYRHYNDGTKVTHTPKIIKEVYGPEEVIILGGGMMATNSMFYHSKNNLDIKEQPAFWQNCHVGDVPLSLYLSTLGGVGYINEYLSTYRIGAVGSWTNKNRFSLKALDSGKRLSKMLKEFDEYTNHKYYKYVMMGRILWLLRSYRDVLLTIKYKFISFIKV